MKALKIIKIIFIVLLLYDKYVLAGISTQPIIDSAKDMISRGEKEEAFLYLEAVESDCAGNKDCDYLLGVLALDINKLSVALNALERVILQDSSNFGAWIDLSLVYIKLGDVKSALSLLDYIEDSFFPPVVVLEKIKSIRNELNLSKKSSQIDVQAGFGYQSNANSGLAVSGILVSPLNSNPVYLQLDPSRQPKGDFMLQIRGGGQSINENDGFFQIVSFGAGYKDYSVLKEFSTQELMAGYVKGLKFRGWSNSNLHVSLGVNGGRIQLGGKGLLNITSLSLGGRLISSNCWQGLKLEKEYRRYLQAGYFDAQIPWISVGAGCSIGSGYYSVEYRVGQDQPDGARPGGSAMRRELLMEYKHKFAERWFSEISVNYGKIVDAQPYSSLLGNRIRQVDREGWKVGFRWVLPEQVFSGASLFGAYEEFKDDSNLALFKLMNRQIMFGFQNGF